jgi:hypothetical protein
MFMKTVKTTFVAGIIFVLMALMTLTTLTACGGSGGGGHDHPSAESDDPGPTPEPGPPTPVPLMLKAIPEDGKITVSWPRIPGLSDYTVSWSDLEGVEPSGSRVSEIFEIFDADSGTTMLEATITGLENGTTYKVQIEAGGQADGEMLCTVGGKTWYVSSDQGSDNNNGQNKDRPLLTVQAALQKAAKDKADYPSKWKEGDSAEIVILGELSGPIEIDLDAQHPYPPITIGGTSDSPLTINGTLTITGGDENSPPVTLAHVTLNGGGSDVVTVEGGNLVIEDGAVITGGGNGVVVNSGGAVTMSGDSRIWGNSGNGVYMTGGAFHMTGGEIGANLGYGVRPTGGGTFTKTGGGTVYGNHDTTPEQKNNLGSINANPNTYESDRNYPTGQ